MLLKDGRFAGHKYCLAGGYAICLAGGKTIEFYNEQDVLLKAVAVEEDKKAA